MNENEKNPYEYVKAIEASGFSIHDAIEVGDPHLWIPSPDLEIILNNSLKGISLHGLPNRTRSKVAKTKVCEALGYPVPKSFPKNQPRFTGQLFDTYVQKADNLQVWNEGLSATRRYVLIRPDANGIIQSVKVVTGDTLALLDKTGTLTQKYQAGLTLGDEPLELISPLDTENIRPLVTNNANFSLSPFIPTSPPEASEILSIQIVYDRLSQLIGKSFADVGIDQERNRGAELHKFVCQTLGFNNYLDDGQFPDIRNQLIEVKLQTAPTIDLGLVRPNSEDLLDLTQLEGRQIRHCDVRYAVFYATIANSVITLTNFFLTTGESFFNRFTQFQGKVLNKKLQIPLPRHFFDTEAE
jgi:hypothetical protein